MGKGEDKSAMRDHYLKEVLPDFFEYIDWHMRNRTIPYGSIAQDMPKVFPMPKGKAKETKCYIYHTN